jgi:hypothetical protein
MEEAESIARAARANKNPNAVLFGQRRAEKNRNRSQKPGPKPVPETRTETEASSVLETSTTGVARKPGQLSISRGGGRGAGAADLVGHRVQAQASETVPPKRDLWADLDIPEWLRR